MLVHDMSWVERRSSDTKWYLYYLFAIIGVVISLVTVLVAHLSWRGWVAGVRAMLRGEGLAALLGDTAAGFRAAAGRAGSACDDSGT